MTTIGGPAFLALLLALPIVAGAVMGQLVRRGHWIVLFIFGAGLVATVVPIVAFRLVSDVEDGGKTVEGGVMLLWICVVLYIAALIISWAWQATRVAMRAPTDTDAPY